MVAQDPSTVKVYTVNGAASGSSSSLPDWLTRKRAAKGKGKRAIVEHIEGSIQLIQGFEFPEASNRIKTTRDGHHAIATGTYKPQIKVWDLDQLSLKFERHSDAENVDFTMLSDDWTKSVHLQNDRSIELHTQGGHHYRTRIPRFGRALAYHFPSCDTLCAAAGPEVFRLNLNQGRFMTPLILQGEGDEEIAGVNVVDINPAHQLFAFGVEGNGTVEFWDPRARSRVGLIRLPASKLLPSGPAAASLMPGVEDNGRRSLSVTALSSRSDGLSYAIGTSTGHTLLYDIRSARPFANKDQGYGLPVKKVIWMEGGSKMMGGGLVLSADKKVLKIWDRNSPATNFTSITPAYDVNDVHHVPDSGLLLLANEGIEMTTYYIPQLGPAPRWCSFLENITEEMEDQTARTAYEDYKFVERSELASLGLDHLVGTPALKPYMHGYFLSLQLYDAARVIANPYAYEEHRERIVRDKIDKMADSRIRARKDAGVKVNKALAEKIQREAERERKREERRAARNEKARVEGVAMEVDNNAQPEKEKDGKEAPSLFTDPRFKALFVDPSFQVDEASREYALMNPSSVAQRDNRRVAQGRTKTAVEEEEEESEKASSDGLGSDSDKDEDEDKSEDSDDAGELWTDDIRARMAARASFRATPRQPQRRNPNVRLVPVRADTDAQRRGVDKNATFGQRRTLVDSSSKDKGKARDDSFKRSADGGVEISWVPTANATSSLEDADVIGDRADGGKRTARKKGVEVFGAGMEKGGAEQERVINEGERQGRAHRRTGMRSGSKNTFRRM